MQKILIYNVGGASPQSVADLVTLFSRNDIFSHPDVREITLTENLDQLDCHATTIVIPGGSASEISYRSGKKIQVLSNLVDKGCHYMGSCAGAFLATQKMDMYKITNTQSGVPEFYKTFPSENTLNLTSEYESFGPLIKNADPTSATRYTPYVEPLIFNGEPLPIPQLYVNGCGFKSNPLDTFKTFEVVAHYERPYNLCSTDEKIQKTVRNIPAIIRRKGDSGAGQGGIFLSGTHVEACVKDSKMIGFFREQSNSKMAVLLSDQDHGSLQKERERSESKLVALLKDTFTST